MGKHIKDFKGLQFGQRLCLGESEKRGRNRYEKCRCLHCGVERYVIRSSLYCGKSKYCGRLITHDMSRTRLYRIWQKMKRRCINKNTAGYEYYGGKGIRYSDEWETFEGFYRDMGKSYENHVAQYGERETTIDRIDVNGNYCKENCRRATWKEQAHNTTRKLEVEYKGKTYGSLVDLCDELGIDYNILHTRLRDGVSLEKAIETPIIKEKERDELGRFKKMFI